MMILLLMLVLVLPSFPAYSQERMEAQVVKFNKTMHDFGIFPKGNRIKECVFEIENRGKSPLVIFKIKTNCGCAVASYTTTPIRPGDTGEIRVKYDGKGKPSGTFIKSIVVYTNAVQKPYTLFIKGAVKELKD